jgi:SecD/SecF fusion protein
MTEKIGRKFFLTLALVLVACASLLVPPLFLHRSPFRLGLDLQGGTRLVYHFDFDEALKLGKISAAEYADKATMLQDFCGIIRNRVDPNGVMELSIRPEGQNRIVIELPGAAELATARTVGKLAQAISATDDLLLLEAADVETVKAFPLSGGVVTIGAEKIAYQERDSATLKGLSRGEDGTPKVDHAASSAVELLSTDDLQKRIENVGELQFLIVAQPGYLMALGTDESKERQKLEAWLAANPNGKIESFNRLGPEEGGPTRTVRWFPRSVPKEQLDPGPLKNRLVPLLLPPEEWMFSGNDLESVGPSQDQNGFPAVHFEIATAKKGAFGDFTEKHVGDQMAIVLNGEIATDPKINSKLPGSGIIEGGAAGFTQKEVKNLVTVLRSGSLRVRPDLLSKNRVGASLGDNYVATSFQSTLVAFGIIVAFMLYFYRKLGVFAVVSLLVNLLLLMGALAFMKATLTLPGVAGIILTLGMAVDGNILIYERLREEMDRGLKLVQAAKAAFERAAVTIIDSNLTTLIAGLILQNIGTGSLRGFAVTLNIGILSTLFTVIVVTEMLVLWDIHRGAKTFTMAKTFKSPNWRFMDIAKYAIAASVLVIVAGDALFISLPNKDKLGIDFLGGFSVKVNTQEPQQVDTLARLVHEIPGTIGESAQVREILDSGSKATGYRQFVVQCKLSGEEEEATGTTSEQTGEKQIRDALAPVLQKDPVQVEVSADGTTASGEILFEAGHSTEDIRAALEKIGLAEVVVDPDPARANAYQIRAKVDPDRTPKDLAAAIHLQFSGHDSAGRSFSLLSPVPESSMVGPQVGGEMRDKAIIAVLLSLVGTILYLRVRFAEYSFGIAVVVSLLHDVLIVFGALAVATLTGLIQAEFDLSMIAAFLTIIGYSQNDTIVIFDRVRENRQHSKKPLREILNDSINQTLARTILTTSTVVLTLIVLFVYNIGSRNVLEAFSFAMLVGVISGAYSTVYVASPVLLWFENRANARLAGSR